ncbi:energy-coupled thiamine transporter ThiT, partial [Acinetobacter baumannii]
MMPIIIVALRRGLLPGILSGFLWGFLQFVMGDAQILTLSQFVLEYFVAFAMVGFAGIASKPLQNTLR